MTTLSSSNPTGGEFTVRGVPISFPFQPYQVQRVLMERVIETLQTKTNALLESPTGTGKTLSLLCSTRAWQRTQEVKPVIIYASRTHAQLEQVIKELKRTAYAGNALVIGSRENSCSHPEVSRLKGRDQILACRSLVDSRTCAQRERTSAEIRRPTLVDIEDLIRPGTDHRFCPYYYARDVLSTAGSGSTTGKAVEIIFMPYNYLVDPISRRGLSVPWNDAVVIIDEAHNIEDVCEDACSFSLDRTQMFHAINEIDGLLRKCASTGGRLAQFDITVEDLSKIKAIFKGLNESFQQCYQETLVGHPPKRKGSDLFDIMRAQHLTFETYRQLIGKLDACVEALNPQGRFVEWIVKCVTRAFELGGEDLNYQAAYQAASDFYRIFFEKNEGGGWKLNFWCFSPGVAMRELQRLGVRSIIVASGTLAPLDSFASSLRIPFPVRLESPHVIAQDRVWLGVVSKGVTGRALNCSFGQRESIDYQQELGNTLASLVRVIPDGVLVFFPSYSVMNACIATWKQCEVWARLAKLKDAIVVEERGVAAEEDYDKALENGGGAMMFAVCRGKASEGMDFRDKRARGVIVIGLPFPSKTDARVVHKRSYMDETRAAHPDHQLLSGQAWYTQQGYRAVNQAVGRAIRHEHDFGAIILLDERFASIRGQLSLWLRNFFRVYDKTFGDSIASLVGFFKHLKGSDQPRKLSLVPQPAAGATLTSSLGAVVPIPRAPSIPTVSSVQRDQPVQTLHLPKAVSTRIGAPSISFTSSTAPSGLSNSRSSQHVLGNTMNIARMAQEPKDQRHTKSSSMLTNSSSSSGVMESAVKRPRMVDSDKGVKEFVATCRSVLGAEGYRRFKIMLHQYQDHDKTVPARALNRQALEIFGGLADSSLRASLLLKLAGFLPPVLGHALKKDAGLRDA